MEPTYYTVLEIRGDYGILMSDQGIENLVALALLPECIMEGERLLWENFEFSRVSFVS